MGNLHPEQHQFPEAVKEDRQAIALQPDKVDAHSRLAQAYTRSGDPALAQQGLDLHDRLRRQQLAEADRQRAEIQEFMNSLKEIRKPLGRIPTDR